MLTGNVPKVNLPKLHEVASSSLPPCRIFFTVMQDILHLLLRLLRIYSEEQTALRAGTALRVVSFCCGGRRIWTEEFTGRRINLAQVQEALKEGARDPLRHLPLL
jgi:hypothetical protein